jgi:hypothetical protein
VKIKFNTKKSRKGTEADDDETGEGKESRPKRKRNNLYSSLSPAVMRATAEERAKSYYEPPQRLRRHHKSSVLPTPNVDPTTVHPAVLDAENAAQASGGKVPQEYLGYDGNLFYCRICLGVGEVVCCDGCPHVFHPKCIPSGLSKSSLDNDDDPWFCPECVEKGMLGKSIEGKADEQPKKKRKKMRSESQDEAEADSTPVSPPRRSKKRCRSCSKKAVENFPLVQCCAQDCNSLLHFPGCPDRVQQDDYAYVHPTFGPLCSVCSLDHRFENGNGRTIEDDVAEVNAQIKGAKEKVKGGRGGGRGSGRGGGRGGAYV